MELKNFLTKPINYFLDLIVIKFCLKRVTLFIIALVISLVTQAHKINAYRIIYIEEMGNVYGAEDLLSDYFKKLGFKTITSYELDDMDSAEKSQLLMATWETFMSQNGGFGEASTVKFTLTDVTGTVVYKAFSKGYYGLLHGPKTITRNLFKKIFKQIDDLHYSFTPESIKVKNKEKVLCATWSEDSIKSYLKTKSPISVEGIFKNYSNSLDYYRIAIIKEKDKYYGIIIDTENKRWERGNIKMILNTIEGNTFDVEYYDFKGKKLNSIGHYENRLLTFATSGINGQTETFHFLKVFPTGKNNVTGNGQSINDSEVQATGSGFIISSNVIATNYHVIESAKKIKVILNVQGTPEEYDAKILSTDKTNDLALLTIKDKKFIPLKPAPYNIVQGTIDVGTSVFTMGYPMSNVLGKEVKITDGLISSKTGFEGDAVTYQISAPIQPGNSGGALFDKKGHLVGITNAGIPSADNVGYAIKSSYLINLIDSAPIEIELPKGDASLSKKELPEIIKIYTPYIAFIKIY